VPQWRFNRFLYEAVGAEWQWNDKSGWTDQQWGDYAESPQLRTFVAYYDGSPAGYYELCRAAEPDEVEVVCLGLLPAFIGRGWGGVLLTRALEAAWEMRPGRVWLHTCTLDHPMAVRNYLARGLTLYKVDELKFKYS
jgi:GNAT superfamily N-acetyltransferase